MVFFQKKKEKQQLVRNFQKTEKALVLLFFLFLILFCPSTKMDNYTILVNQGWSGIIYDLNSRKDLLKSCQKRFHFVSEEKVTEDVSLDGLLFLPSCEALSERNLKETLSTFEKFVTCVGGVAGKCIFIWIAEEDGGEVDKFVEMFSLKTLGCEWEFGANNDGDETYPKIFEFFEEKIQQCTLKPAKRS